MKKVKKNKHTFLAVLGCFIIGVSTTSAQIGMTANNPDKSAVLDMKATTNKGVLIPNVSLNNATDGSVIAGGVPAQGLMVFNTNTGMIGGGPGTIPGFYYWDTNQWKKIMNKGESVSGDNLGNHTATTNLTMSNQNITNGGKLSTQTAAIAKGTDAGLPVVDYALTSVDNLGNAVWKPFPTPALPAGESGTIISVGGQYKIAQEIVVQQAADVYLISSFTQTAADIYAIGNITTKIIDNKNRFSGSSYSNTFTVEEDGIYLFSIYAILNRTPSGGDVIGIKDNTSGQWIARCGIGTSAPAYNNYSFSLTATVALYKSRTYSFAGVNWGDANSTTVKAGSTYSLKRLK